MENKVLEFIQRRFKDDCKWLDGNCYYFAVILKDRFPKGKIYYEVIYGHFVFEYRNKYYDWNGIVSADRLAYLVEWDKFDEYDSTQKERVVKGCIL